MGGNGSGRISSENRKKAVEECFCIAITDFKEKLESAKNRAMLCRLSRGRDQLVAQFEIIFRNKIYLAINYFPSPRSKKTTKQIFLVEKRKSSVGYRWWIRCSTAIDEPDSESRICFKRTSKIYLPYDATDFGCRHCHNLSYRSSQNAHKLERREKLATRVEDYISKMMPDHKTK